MLEMFDTCIISRSKQVVIDVMADDGKTAYGRKTLEQIRAEYPDAEVMPLAEGSRAIDDTFVTALTEIDEEAFMEYLECLPPMNYQVGNGVSFMISELIRGHIATICVMHRDRYFKFQDRRTLSHEDIVMRARAYIEANPS